MAKVVNLRTRRKQKARGAAREAAAEKGARSGEGKAAQRLREAEAALAERRLDGHRRDDA
jgi:hypothetical protein